MREHRALFTHRATCSSFARKSMCRRIESALGLGPGLFLFFSMLTSLARYYGIVNPAHRFFSLIALKYVSISTLSCSGLGSRALRCSGGFSAHMLQLLSWNGPRTYCTAVFLPQGQFSAQLLTGKLVIPVTAPLMPGAYLSPYLHPIHRP